MEKSKGLLNLFRAVGFRAGRAARAPIPSRVSSPLHINLALIHFGKKPSPVRRLHRERYKITYNAFCASYVAILFELLLYVALVLLAARSNVTGIYCALDNREFILMLPPVYNLNTT
ncbi:hypothetical protein EVAR_14891_1 [Eumeta japonica]|uniref:Uncharacterized protein n=1 Tax=Eumeta variegata TaxID=151549 RepID=A0A4C1V3U1_EUMVA|nr:hypothetical protein EVAR_14891_1 [Eumeta japonica]